MSERKSRKDGRRGMRAERGEERQIAVENFFFCLRRENFLVVIFFRCRLHVVHREHNKKRKDFFNLYLSFYAAKFAYTIKLKIAVCLKLSTVKWISSSIFSCLLPLISSFISSCLLSLTNYARDFWLYILIEMKCRGENCSFIDEHIERDHEHLIYELTLMLS